MFYFDGDNYCDGEKRGNINMVENNRSTANSSLDELDMDIISRIFILLNDDPRIRIIKLLASYEDEESYVSFRTIAKRTGINYSKLKQYLEQLERIGIIESVKININNNSRRGYSYYRLREEIRHYIDRLLHKLDLENRHYIYLIAFSLGFVIMSLSYA